MLSPIVGEDGSSAYIDVGVAAIVFAVFYWIEIWDERAGPASADSDRHHGRIRIRGEIHRICDGAVCPRIRGLESAEHTAGVGSGDVAAAMMAPWMIKDWIYVQDPVAPFGSQIFRNQNVHPITVQHWALDLQRYGVTNMWTLPKEVILDGGKTQGVIGLAFLAAPLALLGSVTRRGEGCSSQGSFCWPPISGTSAPVF